MNLYHLRTMQERLRLTSLKTKWSARQNERRGGFEFGTMPIRKFECEQLQRDVTFTE